MKNIGLTCLAILLMPVVALTDEAATLQVIMQGLRDNLAEITDGLLTDDFEKVSRGAVAISQHPQIPPDQAARVAQELGPEMAAFKQIDTRVHDLSLQINAAAMALDRGAAIAAYQTMLEGCFACHSSYKERVAAVLATSD